MKKIFLLCCLFAPFFLRANDQELSKHLVNTLWTDITNKNVKHIKKYISPAFQETVPALQTRRGPKGEIQNVLETNIKSFKVSGIRHTRKGDVLVTTYFVQLDEIINNQVVPLPPLIRLSVWKKVDGKWTWIAHQGGF
jgi:hypothetical protein